MGAYVSSAITEARASVVLRSLRRTFSYPSTHTLHWTCPTDSRFTPQVAPYPACVVSTPFLHLLRSVVLAELASSHAVFLRAGEDSPIQCPHLVSVGTTSGRVVPRSPSDIRNYYGRLCVAPLVFPSVVILLFIYLLLGAGFPQLLTIFHLSLALSHIYSVPNQLTVSA